jgi:hypothetical protein
MVAAFIIELAIGSKATIEQPGVDDWWKQSGRDDESRPLVRKIAEQAECEGDNSTDDRCDGCETVRLPPYTVIPKRP